MRSARQLVLTGSADRGRRTFASLWSASLPALSVRCTHGAEQANGRSGIPPGQKSHGRRWQRAPRIPDARVVTVRLGEISA